jgi:hypothetical protein
VVVVAGISPGVAVGVPISGTPWSAGITPADTGLVSLPIVVSFAVLCQVIMKKCSYRVHSL